MVIEGECNVTIEWGCHVTIEKGGGGVMCLLKGDVM